MKYRDNTSLDYSLCVSTNLSGLSYSKAKGYIETYLDNIKQVDKALDSCTG